jgi:hypothetical protein
VKQVWELTVSIGPTAEFGAAVAAFLALFISIWSARLSIKTQKVSEHSSDIMEQYRDFVHFNTLRMEYPEQGHLLELPETYWYVHDKIACIVKDANDIDKKKFLLQERAMAIAIFSMYERVVYQFDLAISDKLSERAAFLKDVLDYFHKYWFRNPRLYFLWTDDKIGVASFFEKRTREMFADEVGRHHPPEDVDPLGPAAARLASPVDGGV